MRKISKKTVLTVLITFFATLLLVGIVLGYFIIKYNAPFSKFVKVMGIIEDSYVEDVDFEECESAAINAVLETIGDKYAVYYDEDAATEIMQMIDGYYYGIGVEVFANIEKDRIEIVSAYEDSPADKAGIRSGDLLISVDGKEYFAEDLAEAVLYIKGSGVDNPSEKELSIVVERQGERIDFTAKRAKIELYKVSHEMIDGICYIRYTGFTQTSMSEVKKIVDSLDEKTTKGIVIDVRNNPGGELNSAIMMCDLFLEEETIMSTKDKNGAKTVYKGSEGSCTIPLAVIVNGSSASATEVFAGAMQDNERAVIVGEKTYGKGVTQTVKYIDPTDKTEGAIKLTTYKNYTPDGKWINEAISPDIEVAAPRVEGDIRDDAAFKAAADYLIKDN